MGSISILEVDVSSIKNNIKLIKQNLLDGQKLCIVAKANCYGLGARLVKFIDGDADYFAVSSADEFYKLKKFTLKPIIILSPQYAGLKKLIDCGAELCVSDEKSANALIRASGFAKQKCKVHIAVNTGMNRFGFKEKLEFVEIARKLKKSQNIDILGVFSHYFDANCEKKSQEQYLKFKEFKNIFKSEFDEDLIFHIASSGGVFNVNGFDMARCGMAVYTDLYFPSVKLKSKVVSLQKLEVGESAGYNEVFTAKQDTTIAVVSIGYGDGLMRKLSGNGECLINGKRCHIVAVCMDSILVDVTNLQVKIMDEVVLIGKSKNEQIFICDVAKVCDTIDYEILVRISERVKRKYIGAD